MDNNMNTLHQVSSKLQKMSVKNSKLNVLILGASGSVGTFLFQMLYDMPDAFELHIAGRNTDKLQQLKNIMAVTNTMKKRSTSTAKIHKVDVNESGVLAEILFENNIDIVVNATRAYPGVKYGTMSWHTIGAYGIWAPLSVDLVRRVSAECAITYNPPILINTSYSDVVNPWLRTSNVPYPDLGSGNVNHLIPRIKIACKALGYEFNEILYATSHYHDVLISKEGHDGKTKQLLKFVIDIGIDEIVESFPDESQLFNMCKIPMPTNHMRNMMNATSNFEIIIAIYEKLFFNKHNVLHIPGADGNIGGYPVKFSDNLTMEFDTRLAPLENMIAANLKSISGDGIDGIYDGKIFYTEEIREKAKNSLGYDIPESIDIDDAPNEAKRLIELINTFQKS